MKKLLVAALAACTIIGSFATVSMAYAYIYPDSLCYENRFNGSYYYDVGYCKAYVSAKDSARVRVQLYRNGIWLPGKVNSIWGGDSGRKVTCDSGNVSGNGSSGVKATIV